jgi:phage terminase large subunit-like protein
MTSEEELAFLLAEWKYREDGRQIDNFYPDESDPDKVWGLTQPLKGTYARHLYQKQLKYFAAGKEYKRRLLLAANRVSKTEGTLCYEMVLHMTGRYPHWWEGKRFTGPQPWWACAKDRSVLKDSLQLKLLGQVGEFGTGMVPRDSLDFESLKEATKADTGLTSFRVKHVSGGYSSCTFKTYESGRKSFESAEKNILFDEEPPLDIFLEANIRTMTGDSLILMGFTPLQGMSNTVTYLLGDEPKFEDGPTSHCYLVMAEWDDVPHLSEQMKADMLASLPPYQRDARSRGIPMLGAGLIYPVPEADFVVEPFTIPDTWKRVYGFDVGANTAAVWIAQDPNTEVWYTYHEYFKKSEDQRAEPYLHVQALQSPGSWIPGAIDPAAAVELKRTFEKYGLILQNANNDVDGGVYSMWDSLVMGRVKVFNTCRGLLSEMRTYRRSEKNGNIVKENDHRLDAWRYSYMTRNLAKQKTPKNPHTGLPGPSRAW